MSYKELKVAVLDAFNGGNIALLVRVENILKERLTELMRLPKEDLSVEMDDISNKQWLETNKNYAPGDTNANSKFTARSTPDGNCLFNACSLLLRHNESLASILRMLTSVELYLKVDYYLEHPIFMDTFRKGKFSTWNSVFMNSLANDVLEGERCSNADYVKKTAVAISEPFTFVPFIGVLALSNVIGLPIHIHTKGMRDTRLMDLYNCYVIPRVISPTSSQCLFIFWSKLPSGSDNELNHFVPLFDVRHFNNSTRSNETVPDVPFDVKVLKDIFISIGMKRKNTILPLEKDVKKQSKMPKAMIPLCRTVSTPLVNDSVKCSEILSMNSTNNIQNMTASSKSSNHSKKMNRNIYSFFNKQSVGRITQASLSSDTAPIASSSTATTTMPNNLISEESVNSSIDIETPSILPLGTTNSFGGEGEYKYDISYFVQKKLTADEKMEVIKNVWKPWDRYEFPMNNKRNRFQHRWLSIYDWLLYSPSTQGAFCLYCVLFGAETSLHNSRRCQLFTEPYFDWNKAKQNFNRHAAKSPVHGLALTAYTSFRQNFDSKKSIPVNLKLNDLVLHNVEANRKKLKIILEAVVYCARQNISLRGHRDDSQHYDLEGNNPGNFQELLKLMARTGNYVLQDHLENAHRNATYRSKTIQNELIELCAKQIKTSIVKEIVKAREYAVLADEASDISCREQLSLIFRFVDVNSEIREEFLGFLDCKGTTSGEAISNLILKELKDQGIDINNCRGQGYDGAGNMSGKYKGCAARILNENKLAVYCHCQCHSLSLCVCHACQLPAVIQMMNKLRVVQEFFEYPKRRELLIKQITQLLPKDETRKNLIDCCRTRWIQKVDSFDIFVAFYPAVVPALTIVSENKVGTHGHPWNNDSVNLSSSLLHGITNFQFLITLHVVKSLISYLRSLTIRLQEKRADISKAFRQVQTVLEVLKIERRNVDIKHNELYSAAVVVAKKTNISVEKPRTCNTQLYRSNHPSESVSDYYKKVLTIPFLDNLIVAMEERFTPKSLGLYSGFNILPAVMLKTEDWKVLFKPFLDEYFSTMGHFGSIDAELDLWQNHWEREFERSPLVTIRVRDDPPEDKTMKELEWKGSSVSEVLEMCNKYDLKTEFPLIYHCLKLLGTIPVTTCECERSISIIRRLKTYLRSTMTQKRFSSLALLHARRDFKLDLDAIIDKFATKHPRRMQLIDIVNDDPEPRTRAEELDPRGDLLSLS